MQPWGLHVRLHTDSNQSSGSNQGSWSCKVCHCDACIISFFLKRNGNLHILVWKIRFSFAFFFWNRFITFPHSRNVLHAPLVHCSAPTHTYLHTHLYIRVIYPSPSSAMLQYEETRKPGGNPQGHGENMWYSKHTVTWAQDRTSCVTQSNAFHWAAHIII